MRIYGWLKELADRQRSGLYLAAGSPACAKFDGALTAISPEAMAPGEVGNIANELMDEAQRLEFERDLEMNVAVSLPEIGRFRVNILRQRSELIIVARFIVADISSWRDLGLPEILTDLIMAKRGLLSFVGATGSGKSTSLAAMIDYRNRHASGHIVTIEDPVGFVHQHKNRL